MIFHRDKFKSYTNLKQIQVTINLSFIKKARNELEMAGVCDSELP